MHSFYLPLEKNILRIKWQHNVSYRLKFLFSIYWKALLDLRWQIFIIYLKNIYKQNNLVKVFLANTLPKLKSHLES